MAAPRGLPREILGKLHETLVKAINEPATNDALKKVGTEPLTSTPADFAQRIAKDWKSMGEAIRVVG
jgi:tripartite-type tricarboxylate transporter receptor subunit TctC